MANGQTIGKLALADATRRYDILRCNRDKMPTVDGRQWQLTDRCMCSAFFCESVGFGDVLLTGLKHGFEPLQLPVFHVVAVLRVGELAGLHFLGVRSHSLNSLGA